MRSGRLRTMRREEARPAAVPGARARAERLWNDSVVQPCAAESDASESNGASLPSGPATRKLRALWHSAYHLGLIHDRSDDALGAWLRRLAHLDGDAGTTPASLDCQSALKIDSLSACKTDPPERHGGGCTGSQ